MNQSNQPRRQVGELPNPRGAGLYPKDLAPTALPGDILAIEGEEELRRVERVVAQPGVNAFQDGINVAAGGESTDNQIVALQLPSDFAGQFRLTAPGNDIPTDVRFLFDLGAQNAAAFSTSDQRGFWTNTTATAESLDEAGNVVVDDDLNLHLTELMTFEKDEIYVTFDHQNSGGAQQTIEDVTFQGFQYKLSETPVQNPDRRPIPWINRPITPKS